MEKEGKKDMEVVENNVEWVSVSTLAERLNVSTQTIYNRIKCGEYPTIDYVRGKYRGVLVGVKKDGKSVKD